MKRFSIVSIILSTLLIGYIFIIGLPKIASIGTIQEKKPLQGLEVSNAVPSIKKVSPIDPPLKLREKCNSLAAVRTFENGSVADAFLEDCLQGKSDSVAAETTTTVVPETTIIQKVETPAPITASDRKQRCNDFLSHARFDSAAESDAFLKNCLARK